MISALIVLVSVIFLDVVLSGDNAVVIGMAANTLPKSERIKAITFGMGLAAICRIILSLFAISLLHYRAISIVGGLGLFWVAYRLGKDIYFKEKEEHAPPRQGTNFWSAIGLIAVADISMSLDNVLAVAGIARNNPLILVLGLVLSIACVGLASKLMSDLLDRYKWLNWVGVGLIVMIATELIVGIKAI